MSMTSTISGLSSRTSSIIIPGTVPAVKTSGGDGRIVRFDSECILIPDDINRPKTLSKSYSLPLWKKKSSHVSDSDAEMALTSPGISPSTEETHVVLKVPIPRFISKSSRSSSRGRSTSSSPPTPKPLSPCLVHRSPSLSPSTPSNSVRRTSLPISTHYTPKDDSALTIPLRACCLDCVPITEESLKEGEHWQEKFTTGARRRRSASLDNSYSFSLSTSGTGKQPVRGFSAVTVNPSAPAVIVSSASGPRYDKSSNFSITVDEVDRRRKSQEYSEEELKRLRLHSTPSPRGSPTFYSPNAPFSSAPHPLIHRAREQDTSTSSTTSSASSSSDLNAIDYPTRVKSSPIQEEDEDQLFPLPSPRRTPSNSPSPSLNTSPAPSVKTSPAPSPQASTSSLAPPPLGLTISKENLLRRPPILSDPILGHSLSRKAPPPALASKTPDPRRPSPLLIPSPILARFTPIVSPSPQVSPQLIRADAEKTPPVRIFAPAPQPRSPSFAAASSPPSAFSLSSSRSPPGSPLASTRKPRRPSFSLPSLKDALKGAGADVLKGVSSISGAGVGSA